MSAPRRAHGRTAKGPRKILGSLRKRGVTMAMEATMRAVVQRSVGSRDVLRVESWPTPSEPRGDEVLIRIRAGGVCYHDLLVRDGTYRHLVELPLVPVHELPGDVPR